MSSADQLWDGGKTESLGQAVPLWKPHIMNHSCFNRELHSVMHV